MRHDEHSPICPAQRVNTMLALQAFVQVWCKQPWSGDASAAAPRTFTDECGHKQHSRNNTTRAVNV